MNRLSLIPRASGLLLRASKTQASALWIQRRTYALGTPVDVQPGKVDAPGTGNERIEIFVSSEQNKIDVIVQKDLETGGTVTVPPVKWDEKYASTSESIVKAEKGKDKSFEELQVETVRKIHKIEIKGREE